MAGLVSLAGERYHDFSRRLGQQGHTGGRTKPKKAGVAEGAQGQIGKLCSSSSDENETKTNPHYGTAGKKGRLIRVICPGLLRGLRDSGIELETHLVLELPTTPCASAQALWDWCLDNKRE